MKALGIVLVSLAVLAGCGGDDDGDGEDGAAPRPQTSTGTSTTAKTVIPTALSEEEREVADTVAGLLEARNGEDACFERLGAEYVESLGGEDACAKRLHPLVTGDFNRVAAVRVVKPDAEAVADVSGPAGRHVMIGLAKSSTGDWNMNAASDLPR